MVPEERVSLAVKAISFPMTLPANCVKMVENRTNAVREPTKAVSPVSETSAEISKFVKLAFTVVWITAVLRDITNQVFLVKAPSFRTLKLARLVVTVLPPICVLQGCSRQVPRAPETIPTILRLAKNVKTVAWTTSVFKETTWPVPTVSEMEPPTLKPAKCVVTVDGTTIVLQELTKKEYLAWVAEFTIPKFVKLATVARDTIAVSASIASVLLVLELPPSILSFVKCALTERLTTRVILDSTRRVLSVKA